MAIVLRIKLGNLLPLLMEARRPLNPETEMDVEAIKQFLMTSGPARTRDLAMVLSMSDSAVIHLLSMLKERGEIVDLPDHMYGHNGR